ncbi:MAG: LuxR C-terminal-related transcriptional regulator [Phycisphaerales bacterium JB037]
MRVAVVSIDGQLLYVNSYMADRYAHGDATAMMGARLSDFLTDGLADEMLALIKRCHAEQRTIHFEGVFRGKHCMGMTTPLTQAVEGGPAVLLVSRDSMPPDEPCVESLVRLETTELGELSALTPRELEILGLIGQGLTSQQIADRLSRSVKTVEWHRVSIGQKLRVRSRVGLARMAIDAGLCGFGRAETVDDAVATEN